MGAAPSAEQGEIRAVRYDTESEEEDECTITNISHLGVRLSVVEHFVSLFEPDVLKGRSTAWVCEELLKPTLKADQCSWCDYVSKSGRAGVQRATVYICHAWASPFSDLVDALREYVSWYGPVVFWIDLFCVNQFSLALDPSWWRDSLRPTIVRMRELVVVLGTPWEKAVPLQRTWCLYEIFCAADAMMTIECFGGSGAAGDGTASAGAPQTQRGLRFFSAASEEDRAALNAIVEDIDLTSSETSRAEDKAMIMDSVTQSVGVAKLNAVVRDRLLRALRRHDSARSDPKPPKPTTPINPSTHATRVRVRACYVQ
eukprot:Rmarinus@m.27317